MAQPVTPSSAQAHGLVGRVAVVAGQFAPRDRAIARLLARAGARVVLLGADAEQLVEARTDILEDLPDATVGIARVTGPTPRDVVVAGDAVLRVHPRVDLLVHTACGADTHAPAATIDASPAFAATAALMPGLSLARRPHVITVTPRSDVPVGVEVVDGNPRQSQLNLLDFVAMLHRVVAQAQSRVRSIAVDPGPGTGGWDGAPGPLKTRLGRRSDEREARPALVAATSPSIPSGHIVTPMFPRSGQTMNLPIGEPSRHAAYAWRRAEAACRRSLAGDMLVRQLEGHRGNAAG